MINLMPTKEGSIDDVRFRRGWFGRMILQVRYQLVRPRLLRPNEPAKWEVAGVSAWRDVNANDISETIRVAQYMRLGARQHESRTDG